MERRELITGSRVPFVSEEDIAKLLGVPDPWAVMNPPGERVYNVKAIAMIATFVPLIGLFGFGVGSKNGVVYGSLVALVLSMGAMWLFRYLGVDLWIVRRRRKD